MNNKWNSIIEVVLVIVIITFWLIWAFEILGSWQRLAWTSENRVKAINIAREWLEIIQNIRDTNWIKFSSDYKNCWNTKDYSASCIWSNVAANRIWSWSYKLYQSWAIWYLSWVTTPPTTDSWFLSTYSINLTSSGLTDQINTISTPCWVSNPVSCKSVFAREITISYPSSNSVSWEKMEVHSIVKWLEPGTWIKSIDLQETLTNWKTRF